MTSLTRSETARWLLEQDDFLILTHRRPDGDTLGSAAVLCRGLRQLGKSAHVLENPEVTGKRAAAAAPHWAAHRPPRLCHLLYPFGDRGSYRRRNG